MKKKVTLRSLASFEAEAAGEPEEPPFAYFNLSAFDADEDHAGFFASKVSGGARGGLLCAPGAGTDAAARASRSRTSTSRMRSPIRGRSATTWSAPGRRGPPGANSARSRRWRPAGPLTPASSPPTSSAATS